MPWYRAGSVAVTNGSVIVTGAGTDFVGNTQAGEVFLGPDGRVYEISGVQSATQLTIIPSYQGATAGGQAYGIQPTSSFARDLAVLTAQLLNTFGAVRDGIGQGLIPSGTVSTPGLRFSADQDTGLFLSGGNTLAFAAGGVQAFTITPNGFVAPSGQISKQVDGGTADLLQLRNSGAGDNTLGSLSFWAAGTKYAELIGGYSSTAVLRFDVGGAEAMRVAGGNLLVGTKAGVHHVIQRSVGAGVPIASFRGDNYASATIYSTGGGGISQSSADCVLGVLGTSSTGRSINAGGTVNASGADYAEYMLKAAGCGVIAKGDVCGVDRDGKLTKTWADAISFVIKSTDPSYIGNDKWADHLRPKPEQPGAEPQAPIFPAVPADDADEASVAAWVAAQAAYPALLASYQSEHAAWQQAVDAYAADLAAWKDELEIARAPVDRIAFCGQVPCNVTGEFDVGDYIIAAPNGAGIKAIAVRPDAMTLPQYMHRIGKVWAIRDGRAWIDVQHG